MALHVLAMIGCLCAALCVPFAAWCVVHWLWTLTELARLYEADARRTRMAEQRHDAAMGRFE